MYNKKNAIIAYFINIFYFDARSVQKMYMNLHLKKECDLYLLMFPFKSSLLMKNQLVKHLIFLLIFTTVALSCIDEYTIPKTTAIKYEAELVIEGRILAGEESVFNLTYTTPLNNEEKTPEILNAQIYVIGQNGYRSEVAEFDLENNCYTIDTRSLENNTHYAVEVTVDGDTFQSDFQSLLKSPEIDEVIWQENESSVSIYVTTLAEKTDSRHFMWSFEEDWEFHAEVDMRGNKYIKPVYNKRHYPDLTEDHNPYLYCWMHNTSRNIHLYSSANLYENQAKNIKLHEISIEDIRISYIYSILVKQWSLSDEAYNYYATLKRYTEEPEGLFTPILSDYQGNIRCISNPSKRVHGYVLASNVTTKRIFIYEEDFKHMRSLYSDSRCSIKNWEGDFMSMGAIISSYPWASPWVVMAKDGKPEDLDALLYNWFCVDCRHTKGATKKRPDFWPNNHE